jgi:hypothetical protein
VVCLGRLIHEIKNLTTNISNNRFLLNLIPVEQPSWKFPDKNSGDLDIEYLLELYDFAEDDPEGSQ